MPRWWIFICIVIFTGSAASVSAAQQAHLLGFVERLCSDESYCFELRVEAQFIETASEKIIVRFDRSTLIYDPENYELTLAQQNIVDGSHLRLLISPEPDRGGNHYRAVVIWIGD